jgi:hypothetical protein
MTNEMKNQKITCHVSSQNGKNKEKIAFYLPSIFVFAVLFKIAELSSTRYIV